MTDGEGFAEEAARFELWARCGIGQGEAAAHEALLRIAQLYAAGLSLPPPGNERLDASVPDLVQHDEWSAVLAAANRLPLDNYAVLFNPLLVPPEDPVVGSLADDIADIYRDVVTGLRLYQAGRDLDAIWEWSFNFRSHWGQHATSAIRALHCWLAENAPDQLSTTD